MKEWISCIKEATFVRIYKCIFNLRKGTDTLNTPVTNTSVQEYICIDQVIS